MSDPEVGFVSMAGPRANSEAPTIGVGMLGYAFMGKAHTNAYKTLPYMMYPPVAIPRLVAIAGRNEEAVSGAAQRYGFETYYTDWRGMVKNPDVPLFFNSGPNDTHAGSSFSAGQASQHVSFAKTIWSNFPSI